MKAARLVERRRPLELADLPDPAPGAGEAVVEVEAEGICRTDWHVWNGDWDWVGLVPTLPLVMGHELGGTVVAVGAGVSRVRPGDRVTTPFHESCGRCGYCMIGRSNLCDLGATNLGVPGALANPMLQLFSGQTQIAINDNWQQAAATAGFGTAPFVVDFNGIRNDVSVDTERFLNRLPSIGMLPSTGTWLMAIELVVRITPPSMMVPPSVTSTCVFTRSSHSPTAGEPDMSRRSASVFTKNPISSSSSSRPRFATGVPMTRSSWPDRRASSAAHPASNVMNSVVP